MEFPQTIDWFVTSKCNLKCNYCFGPIPEKEDEEIIKRIANKLIESKTERITLCGGEPFLNRHLADIVAILVSNKKKVFISSNGHFPEKVNNVLERLTGISISLDGYNYAESFKMRGSGVDFNKAQESIHLIKNTSPQKLKITTVLSKVNYHQIFNLGELVKEINPNVWRILQFVPRMKGSFYNDDYQLSTDQFDCIIEELKKKFPLIKIYSSNNLQISSCFLVDHQGNILLPQENDYKIVGNCLKDDLDSCWQYHWKSKHIHEANKSWMKEMK